MKLRLTPNDIDILCSVAAYKIMSVRQIRDAHFSVPKYQLKNKPTKTEKDKLTTAANRVRQLEAAKMLEARYAPLPAGKTKNPTRPSKLVFFPPTAQKRVKKTLLETGRAADWERIEENLHTFNKEHEFSSGSLAHEEGITEVFMSVNKHTSTHPTRQTPFLIRTSPRHPQVKEKVTVNRIKTVLDKEGKPYEKRYQNTYPLNPDFFWCDKPEPKTHNFFLCEFDNDTSNTATFFNKLEVYYSFLKQGLFPPLSELFGRPHALDIPDYSAVSFRVLTVVSSMKRDPQIRVNRLLADSLKIPSKTFYNFATLDQFRENPYGAIWHNRAMFEPLAETYKKQYRNALDRVRNVWFDENIPALKKATLI